MMYGRRWTAKKGDAMDVWRLKTMLNTVPGTTEIRVSDMDGNNYQLNTVDIEYPGDETEGEICINFRIETEE
jgi:hypothetical protein